LISCVAKTPYPCTEDLRRVMVGRGLATGEDGGRYRTRTCDLVRVKHAL
jgi:hypothetical protein